MTHFFNYHEYKFLAVSVKRIFFKKRIQTY